MFSCRTFGKSLAIAMVGKTLQCVYSLILVKNDFICAAGKNYLCIDSFGFSRAIHNQNEKMSMPMNDSA